MTFLTKAEKSRAAGGAVPACLDRKHGVHADKVSPVTGTQSWGGSLTEPAARAPKGCVLAVDLGGRHGSCALVFAGRVLGCETIPLDSGAGLAAALPLLAESLGGLLAQAPAAALPCAGIGFSFCGLVDPSRCRILSTNGKYDDGPRIDLAGWARDRFGLLLRLENDARTALLGERYAGAGRGFDDIAMMTLGTGVGGAAMIGGRLLHGKHFQAGCLGGHLRRRLSGPRLHLRATSAAWRRRLPAGRCRSFARPIRCLRRARSPRCGTLVSRSFLAWLRAATPAHSRFATTASAYGLPRWLR